MWKKRLYLVKNILKILVTLVYLIPPFYAWMNNPLDNFSIGLLRGALWVAIPLVVIQLVLGFWKVNITEAEEIGLDHLNTKEKIGKSIDIDVRKIEEIDNKWYISGKWVPKERIYIVPGSPKLGDPNLGKEFEIVVDSRTGRTIRYSSSYVKSTTGRSSDEK